ncbi:MAG: HlyD family efflux transporter periplasmic adaptor subunit [Gammaproteobacteria bacterium]|nr:MAG: HlyD family efflux transporter periplasmic adaptor subunit [Gammaproteobacteria bacterium]
MAQDDALVLISGDRREGTYRSDYWARLTHATDMHEFTSNWLDIQCRLFTGVIRGVVVLHTMDTTPFAPVAIWPEGIEGSPQLAAVVDRSLNDRQVVVEGAKRQTRNSEPVFIAHPILVDDELYGSVALEFESRSETTVQGVVERLGWGIGWLEALARRKVFTSKARLVTVLELIATSLQHERFQAAATAVVTELATIFGCERVSIGFLKGGQIKISALSHSASFAKKANLIRHIEAVMEEAADQLATVLFPPRKDSIFQLTRAHEELLRQHGAGSICTIPLTAGSTVLGAIALELPTDKEFDEHTVDLCEHAALLLGPMLDIKRKEDRWLVRKAWDSLLDYWRKLVGPRHATLKFVTSVFVLVITFFSVVDSDYRITADASLEGKIQRAITAAMQGYIVSAHARAGDIVRKGEVLATLDDRDLQLERLNLLSQGTQHESERRQAIAEGNKARMRVLEAQNSQVKAQINLVDDQIARTRLLAPFDAVVVKGDLSQSLGAAVERGNVLFELAPLDSYRVIMKVDERDITDIKVGQSGILSLTSAPNEKLDLVVEKITPVSVVDEGRNFFRVEAVVKSGGEKLRPGMEGVGKIHVDQRKLIWIWTHKLTHWLRMWMWSWWP